MRGWIDGPQVRRLYLEEGMTAAAIGARVGCSTSTVIRRLRGLGVSCRPRGPSPARPGSGHPAWSPELGWVVGLMATDGNLSGVRGGMSITSRDIQVLEAARRCLRLSNRLLRVTGGWGTAGHRLQWRSRTLHEWLVSVGLTPRKSLTLGPVTVPDEVFVDFLRGCIDGDGSVLVYTDRSHTRRNARYVYTRVYVSLVSASRAFIDWIRATIRRLLGVEGSLRAKRAPTGRPLWDLRYAKRASVRLLRSMYHSTTVPCLARKRAKAEPFIAAAK